MTVTPAAMFSTECRNAGRGHHRSGTVIVTVFGPCAAADRQGQARDRDGLRAVQGACGYSIDQMCRLLAYGFLPAARFTSPDARAQSRCRPVSWLAGLGLRSAFSPGRGNGIWTRLIRLQLRGQPPFGSSRFSPCGPPSSAAGCSAVRFSVEDQAAAAVRRRNAASGGGSPHASTSGRLQKAKRA